MNDNSQTNKKRASIRTKIKPKAWRFTLLIIPLIMVLCQTAQSENMTPEEEKTLQEPTVIPVAYVTLREKTGESYFSEYFGGMRGKFYTGTCFVSFSPIPSLEEIAESSPIYIPDEKIGLTDIKETSTEDFLKEISSFYEQDKGNIVIYIHGYRIDFEKSCRHSALFQRALGLDGRLLLFSWPAEGDAMKYMWDEADLAWSVPYLTNFLSEIIKRKGKGKIDIVAHSLGTRGALQALVRMSYLQSVEPLINELVLIAPDIDAEIFKQEFPLIKQLVKRITVYASENDKALKLSREVHGYSRLGEAGEYLTLLEGLDTIDTSEIENKRISGHLYHLFDQEVIADLTLLLNEGKAADKRPSLKEVSKNGLSYWRMEPVSK